VYSAGNYAAPKDGSEKHALHSHNPAWLNVARKIGRGEKQIEPLFPLSVNQVEKPSEETLTTISQIDFEDLSRFFQSPQSNFLRNKLRVYIQDESNDWNNVEPFDLSNFADSSIRSIALTQEKAGQSNTGLMMAKASAQLPQGMLGEMLQQTEQETVDELLVSVNDQYPDFFTQTLSDYVADLTIGNFNITGVLSGLRPAGQIILISDRLYAWRKVQLWLKHLLLCCAKPEGVSCTTQLISLDGTYVFGEVDSPEDRLVEWLAAFQQGQQTPLPFFAKTSFEYAKAFNKKPDQEAALKKAGAKWWDGFNFPGECSKPANEFLYRGHSPLNEEFATKAETLLCPLLQSEVS
jgi:exodeoxyribonuclease V gamma subunit